MNRIGMHLLIVLLLAGSFVSAQKKHIRSLLTPR